LPLTQKHILLNQNP